MGFMKNAYVSILHKGFKDALRESLEKINYLNMNYMKDVTNDINPIILKGIIVPIKIFSNGSRYFITNDNNNMLYYGEIDPEGLVDTIEKDLLTLSHFYNYVILIGAFFAEPEKYSDNDAKTYLFNNNENVIQEYKLGLTYRQICGHDE